MNKSLIESPIEKIRLKRVIDLLIRHHYLSHEHYSVSTDLNFQCFAYTKLLYDFRRRNIVHKLYKQYLLSFCSSPHLLLLCSK